MSNQENALATLEEMGLFAKGGTFNKGMSLTATARGGDVRHVSIRGAVFNFSETDTPTEERVLIIDAVRSNNWYSSEYESSNTSAPDCFSLQDIRAGVKEADMVPHAESADKQRPACLDCPQNAWGSGKGNSKACKNYVRVAFLRGPVETPADAKKQVFVVQLPPTALKAWTSLCDDFEAHEAPAFFTCHADLSIASLPSGGYTVEVARVVAEDEGPVTDPEVLVAVAQRHEKTVNAMLLPPPQREKDQPKLAKRGTPTKKKKVSKKAGAKKKVTRRKV